MYSKVYHDIQQRLIHFVRMLRQNYQRIMTNNKYKNNLEQIFGFAKFRNLVWKNHPILKSTRVTQLFLKLILLLIIFHCLSLLKCYEEADVFRDVMARASFVTCTHSHVWYQPALCPNLLLIYAFVVFTFTQADLCPFFIWFD